ncbi:aminoglycoside phosphotransferase family protein [Streptomyces sp. SID13031]|uniref:aminoglycoside phosphotransferase family protein n=1 Tax=Streptomyces sp. SID13031 TaxID=2706046 RepID=UPI0013C585C7|nr:aminoglycoside phosphotransferase family protein [Streptomyces sp. SID13031]NEA32541.1 aminoglycoside phosphotransferase family protein [Streptomyces sp. SID13031]
MSMEQRQRELLAGWLPRGEVVRDLSWGLVGTTVLELMQDGIRYVVKAGDTADSHIAREVQAHQSWLKPWTAQGRAPELVHGDEDAKLLVTRYLPGELVQGTDHEYAPETYRQAGQLLAQLHGQLAIEGDFEAAENKKALAWLDKPHRIAPGVADQLRATIRSWPTPTTLLVPTHGDWQPRNWLIHEGTVSVIDFGRAGLRPAYADFGRLSAQQFRTAPALEAAFLDGYGTDPRDPETWQRQRIRESIGTTAWAHQVGSEPFEQQGLRMLTEALTPR